MNTITFKILSWVEWSEAISKRIAEELKHGNITVDDLIFAPKLDPDNPKDFCKIFAWDDVYENNVFVKDHKEDNCYWFINGDTTSLIYKPKLA